MSKKDEIFYNTLAWICQRPRVIYTGNDNSIKHALVALVNQGLIIKIPYNLRNYSRYEATINGLALNSRNKKNITHIRIRFGTQVVTSFLATIISLFIYFYACTQIRYHAVRSFGVLLCLILCVVNFIIASETGIYIRHHIVELSITQKIITIMTIIIAIIVTIFTLMIVFTTHSHLI